MAGSFLGSLLVEIKGDNSKLDKSIKGSQGSVKKFSKFAVAAYALVGVAIIAMSKKFSKAASDADEIGSKYATIFRDISGEAESVADSFAENFGLAGSSARELLGNTADLLTGFGLTQKSALDLSLQTNELAADLASFSNAQGGAAAVSKALTSAYTGERESLKTYGIIITEATVKTKILEQAQEGMIFATEQQAKISATLALAIEQSGNAIGDVARTFQSHANVTRRLEESTKSFNEEMGSMVNEGLTPMLIVTDKLVKSLADWLIKLNDTRDVLKELAGEGVSADISLKELQNTLEILNKRTEQLGRGGSQQLRDQIEAVEELIANYDHVHDRINRNADAERLYANIVKDRAAQAKELKDIEGAAREVLLELQFDQLSAEEQQIQLLNEEIIKYAELRSQGADVQELLNFLIAQRNELQAEGNEQLEEQGDLLEGLEFDWVSFDGVVTDSLAGQSEAVKQLEIDYESLAESGIGSLVSAFENMGDKSKDAWEVAKQAGKDAISSVLRGLAETYIVRSAAALVVLNIPAAIGWASAASAAFTASGVVQNLAEGGVLQPSSGGTPAIMAEAGVPEMAMPLTSSAINPFADAVASRISTTTNNNTQNFNSTFSLSDDNQLREAARKLFPFMRDEDIRRGITV